MEVKDLIFNKYYIVEVNSNNTLCKYSGVVRYDEHTTYYAFMYYSHADNEYYAPHLTRKQINTMVQPKPFMYDAMFGGIGGLKRWFNQLTNLLV